MNINKAAQAMGRKGGKVSGGRKAEAARENFKRAREIKAAKQATPAQVAEAVAVNQEGSI